jgi:hypothetical protein
MTTETAGTETVRIHKFQEAGLGAAPYRFDGMTENVYSACPGHSQPGGTCDYCGTGIQFEFWLVSADGKRFKVGSDCIHKADSGNDRNFRVIVSKVKAAENARKKLQTQTRQDARIAAAVVRLETVRPVLASQPHPNDWLAKQGKTLADWCDYMMKNAGRTGKVEAAKVIEKAGE